METSVCVTFLGGKGHCNVNIIPSDFETFKVQASDCIKYELTAGKYSIAVVGVSPAGGTIVEAFDDNGKSIGKKEIKKEGNFSRFLVIKI